MLFNSPIFVLFFGVVFCLYWALRDRRYQNILLLVASYVFYGAWSWTFLSLLIISSLVDYVAGLMIQGSDRPRTRRWVLIASIVVNLGILGTFKYSGFFIREAVDFLQWLGFQANVRTLELILPLGISFYTFQSLSYTVDVYRKKMTATRNLLDYSLYVAFFPQLVAGPIERATHLLPQFQKERHWSSTAFASGLQLMLWGLFKKVVIADNLGPYVNAVYGDPGAFSGVALTTATLFFAFQIYCDFSGYSDTARGVARTLGFELIVNFDLPYFSKNPVEFWRRWHISLSQWFQDYLYFPLAMRYMRKGGWASKYKAHIISMGLIGLWHGANWTFIVFGLYWGSVIALYLYATERLGQLRSQPIGGHEAGRQWTAPFGSALSAAATFIIVCVGWVLFRSQSIGEAWYVLSHFLSPTGLPDVVRAEVPDSGLLWTLVIGLWVCEWLYRSRPGLVALAMGGEVRQLLWRHAMVIAILFSYVAALEMKAQPFIYFQF